MDNIRSRKEYNEQRKKDVEDKKLEIIDATQKLFLTDGLGNVTMGQIMKETQTSRATMYRYFPSIHPIVFEIQYRMMKEIFKDLKKSETKSMPPNEVVYQGVITLIDNFHKHINAYNYLSMFMHFYAEDYPDELLSRDYMVFLRQLVFGENPEEKVLEKYQDLITSADVVFSYLQKLAHRKVNNLGDSSYKYELEIVRNLADKIFKG